MSKNIFSHVRKKIYENEEIVPAPKEDTPMPAEEVASEIVAQDMEGVEIPEITEELVDELYSKVDNILITKDQFKKGLEVELEHFSSLGQDLTLVSNLVVDHLKESANYYTYLEEIKVRIKAEHEEPKAEASDQDVETKAEGGSLFTKDELLGEPISSAPNEGKVPKKPTEVNDDTMKELLEKGKDLYIPKGVYNEVDESGNVLKKVSISRAVPCQLIRESETTKIIKVGVRYIVIAKK
jgi:hypothetical protein